MGATHAQPYRCLNCGLPLVSRRKKQRKHIRQKQQPRKGAIPLKAQKHNVSHLPGCVFETTPETAPLFLGIMSTPHSEQIIISIYHGKLLDNYLTEEVGMWSGQG